MDFGKWLLDNFGAGWALAWDVIASVGVPILAAGLAAWVVVVQIRRSESADVDARRGTAVRALTDLLVSGANISVDGKGEYSSRQLLGNSYLAIAYTNIPKGDVEVVRWAAGINGQINQMGTDWVKSERDRMQAGVAPATTLGPERAAIGKLAAETISDLIQWARGDDDRTTGWFEAQNAANARVDERNDSDLIADPMTPATSS